MKAGFCRKEPLSREKPHEQTAVREVYEESGVHGTIIKYVGKSQYSFSIPEDTVEKEVHWYLMVSSGYYSRPQREEYFVDSGYYKYHEAYHLLKFSNDGRFWKSLSGVSGTEESKFMEGSATGSGKIW